MQLLLAVSLFVAVCVSSLDGQAFDATWSTTTPAMTECESGITSCTNQFQASVQGLYELQQYRSCVSGVYCPYPLESYKATIMQSIQQYIDMYQRYTTPYYSGSSQILPVSGLIISIVFIIKTFFN